MVNGVLYIYIYLLINEDRYSTHESINGVFDCYIPSWGNKIGFYIYIYICITNDDAGPGGIKRGWKIRHNLEVSMGKSSNSKADFPAIFYCHWAWSLSLNGHVGPCLRSFFAALF